MLAVFILYIGRLKDGPVTLCLHLSRGRRDDSSYIVK